MDPQKLLAIGLKPFFQNQILSVGDAVVARVSAHHGTEVLMLGEAGEFRIPVQLAKSAGEIAVGDWLVLDPQDHRAIQRLDRQSLLYRKAAGEETKAQAIVANLDTIFIVSSCNEDFNLSRIERYIAMALQAQVNPVIVLTKADLCEDANDLRRQAEDLHVGIVVETVDARDPEQVDVLKAWCGTGDTVALLGSSGVGKSTLANALGAGDLATGAIRDDDGKGRHTTTSRSLHLLPTGGVLVDNPGVRELQLPDCEDGLHDLFADVIELTTQCRFGNCSHEGDAGCAIAQAIDAGDLDERRYNNYRKLIAEQERNARTLAERRDRDRNTTKFQKSVQAGKRRRKQGR